MKSKLQKAKQEVLEAEKHYNQAKKKLEEAREQETLTKVEVYESLLSKEVVDFVAPEHERISCSSNENKFPLTNVGRCNRCTLLHFLHFGWDSKYDFTFHLFKNDEPL